MKTLKYVAVCLALCASAAFAGSFTFVTPAGSVDSSGDPVDASVTFTTSVGNINIVLTDLLANPKSAGQLLSDLSFTINGSTTGASLGSSSGLERTVNNNGTFTDGSTVSAGWVLSVPSAGTLHLDVLSGPGHAGPAHLIIGPPGPGNVYSNANGSIAGNGPHNPFLGNSATFSINLASVNADTVITSATFSFGTTSGDNVPGGPSPTPPPSTPDGGSTVMLLGAALGLAELLRRAFANRTVLLRARS